MWIPELPPAPGHWDTTAVRTQTITAGQVSCLPSKPGFLSVLSFPPPFPNQPNSSDDSGELALTKLAIYIVAAVGSLVLVVCGGLFVHHHYKRRREKEAVATIETWSSGLKEMQTRQSPSSAADLSLSVTPDNLRSPNFTSPISAASITRARTNTDGSEGTGTPQQAGLDYSINMHNINMHGLANMNDPNFASALSVHNANTNSNHTMNSNRLNPNAEGEHNNNNSNNNSARNSVTNASGDWEENLFALKNQVLEDERTTSRPPSRNDDQINNNTNLWLDRRPSVSDNNPSATDDSNSTVASRWRFV
jgi:hypothetical protein